MRRALTDQRIAVFHKAHLNHHVLDSVDRHDAAGLVWGTTFATERSVVASIRQHCPARLYTSRSGSVSRKSWQDRHPGVTLCNPSRSLLSPASIMPWAAYVTYKLKGLRLVTVLRQLFSKVTACCNAAMHSAMDAITVHALVHHIDAGGRTKPLTV